ncbi:DEAD/DEAH box helicase [Exiguobacterium sp. Leaf187]|uniref:DEAD/DEAH box helicase n=2 Tax=Exiguobacterium TaxID=33986 RepID=A0A0V8GD23_9BACL|nr:MULTISPECIES: DEAD/DEAH box helicase [Exiguobacterium]AHA28923.1 DEAD/DEAH box helicase [Exiguobacterium sp. MH3]AOS99773.1 DEAD/DEAH box helicase [Exiguobacterium sp. U13-1]KQS21680.1 DEAD/DEAH box helicase [Exiguobacterium sp. Leaf187]KSU48183.1 DEAD/DEAH box helicase [Exiguobacterium enclense]KTR25687.1 DEAD/DEAH box helicase [Exiguobacterium indicum]
MNFTKPFLQEAWERARFTELMPVQEQAIPLLREGKDVLAEAPTGTGKTLAYVIPALEKIEVEEPHVQVVITAPTRELVMQIHQVIQLFAQGSGIKSGAFIGGVELKRQYERLKKKPQIIVGTPGRLVELIDSKKLKMHKVKLIVLDEADQIYESGMSDSATRIANSALRDRQLAFVSATLPERTAEWGRTLANNPETIRVERAVSTQVTFGYLETSRRQKPELLRRLANMQGSKVLTFINNRSFLGPLNGELSKFSLKYRILDAEKGKRERMETLRSYKKGEFPLLVTTGLAARGLDIEAVTHVVHYDLPESLDDFVHRSGRTGRGNANGMVLALVTDQDLKHLKTLAKQMGVEMEAMEIYRGEVIPKREFTAPQTIKRPATPHRKGRSK